MKRRRPRGGMRRRGLRSRQCWSLVACLLASAGVACDERQVVAYTSVDRVFSEPVFRAFEQRTGVHVHAVYDTEEAKSTGVLNRLIAEAQNPQADVFWSGDPVRPLQLVQRRLVEPYRSPEAAGIPSGMRAADGSWTGFAARARVLLVNTKRVATADMPGSVRDLADVRWRGQTALANPLFGTTTMHVAAWFSVWGQARARAFLDALRDNDVRIASSNGEVQRLVVSGEVAFGLTDTDDANEAVKQGAAVAVVYPDQDVLGTLLMPTSVVLMKHAPHAAEGRNLIDFLLGAEVERQLAESAAHMPLREGVPTPKDVRAASSMRVMRVDYAKVAEQIEAQQGWLRAWLGL